MTKSSPDSNQQTQVKERTIPRYKVIFMNDNKTTFEFVVLVLNTYFGKTIQVAADLAMEIHNNGLGCAGIYPLELAELKRDQTLSAARASGYPLTLTLERE